MTKQTIAKNTTYLTLAYIGQKILAFVYFVLIARFIGVEDLGKYTFALSFTTMFAVFIDFGLSSALIRESAKSFDKTSKYLSSILTSKSILAILSYLVVILVINLMGYPPITKNLVYLSGLLMMLDSFTLSFWGVFRGGQNLKYEAFSIVISQVVVVLSGAYVLLTHQSLMFLMLPLLAGGLFNFVYSSIMVRRKLNVRYCWKFDPEILKFLFKIALPFALIAIFSRIYGNIDSVLLSYLKGDAAVGFYQTAMKVPFALQFIPSAFAAAIFPAFSYYFVHDKAKLKFSFDKAMLLLTIFVVPISFGLLSLSDEVIPMLFGQQFINSVLTLKILVFGLIFVFLNFPLGALLNGCDKQVTNTKLVGLVMALNIILNLIFIPQYSYIGAAAVFLVCHALLFLISLFVARKIIPYSRRNLILVFAKTILSAVIMTIAVLYLKQSMNLVLVMVIGAIIYIGVLYLVKGFSRQDMTYLKQSMLRK